MADTSSLRMINLALQGGGSHGAFSWGVLDRLLEDETIEIEAIAGASAGAMNAVALADGLAQCCREDARATLRRFWDGVCEAARSSPLQRTPFDQMFGGWSLDHSPAYLWLDLVSRVVSPYEINPLNLNPLRDIVDRLIDFDRVRASPVKLFLSATNVETGRTKVFRNEQLTIDHVMASACLPFMFHAVEIDGVAYWDGGYMGNPPLWPLFDACEADDVVIVQINPIKRPGKPHSARDILNRLNEITFNASLLRELRAVDFVTRLLEEGRLEGTGYRRVLVHMIEDEATLSSLGASSKLNTEHAFIDMLFHRGRAAAEQWLAAHGADIGVKSSIDIRKLFQGEEDALDGYRIHRQAQYRKKPRIVKAGKDS
ncbi:MAG: patatin-like phospholipase family protein [Alphaproteobacteria bacterium]|nr:patatin-like phospholipase family protein [Alphaproteobacteria bacterium]